MDFIEFMIENFTVEELLGWAEFYKQLYIDYPNDEFWQRADYLLDAAIKKYSKEVELK